MRLIFGLFLITLLGACNNDELKIAKNYDGTNYVQNKVVSDKVLSDFSAFTSYLKKADQGETLDTDTAKDLLSPLALYTEPSYYNHVANNLMPALVEASGKTFEPTSSNPSGGLYVNRILDPYGKEILQEIEKGMFLALHVYQMIRTYERGISLAQVDELLNYYGASPAFPNTNTAANTDSPDRHSALYLARRDMADGKGFYDQVKGHFLKLQALAQKGDKFSKDKHTTINELILTIEEGIAATAIHYGFTGVSKLSLTNAQDVDKANGLHDLSEAVGFVHGLSAIDSEYRKISDEQVTEILALLLSPQGDNASMLRFITEPAQTLPNITQMQNKLKQIYGFSTEEMQQFRQNWISVQGR